MTLFHHLLHMFRSRTAGAGLEESAALHQRDDGEHLGAGAQLQDREQIGEIVAEHVAGDRNGLQAVLHALQGETHRIDRGHDPDVQVGGVVILEILLDLGDQLLVVGTLFIEPEYRR